MADNLKKLCPCSARKQVSCEHSWYLIFMFKRVHHRISLNKYADREDLDKNDAKALADELKTAIRKGLYPPPQAPAPAVATAGAETFETFGGLWIAREREGRVDDWRSDKSRISRLSAISLEDASTFGERPIGRITADDLELAFRTLETEGLTGQTLNKYLQTCQHLQRWGVRKGYLQRPWFDADNRPVQRAKPRKRARRLEPDQLGPDGKLLKDGEERRLIKAASPWMQRLIIAALETGMRRGELLKLRWRHVDMVRGRINLPAEITKTDTGRTVPISARLRPVLELVRKNPLTNKDHEGTAYVFGNAAGAAVASPKKSWEVTVLKAHGITPVWTPKPAKRLTPEMREHLRSIDLHFHDLRHEAGSRWIEAGWPVHHVQHMLGHADLKQTSTYLNATVLGLEESMRKLDETRNLQNHVPSVVVQHSETVQPYAVN